MVAWAGRVGVGGTSGVGGTNGVGGQDTERVAIVTGGSNGIGRAITQAFVDAGGSVVVCDLVDSGYFAGQPAVLTLAGDVAEPGLADAALRAAVDRFGRADVLVNDAASYPDGTLLEMTPQDWDRVFSVNVTGTFMMISTGSARSPRPGGAAYAASKAAVETMSKVFAMELGQHGVRVNVVAPGYIDVRGWSDAFPERAPEELRQALVTSIPLGVAGHPADIASAVLFLAGAGAAHINGAVLDVDGGSGAGRYGLRSHVSKEGANVRG
jgi:3-oxoacyl-[acyl-carrier protein] reductase